MLMKNNFLSKAYGGVTVARRKLNGLGLPRQWKVMTSTLLLLFTFAIGNVWGATFVEKWQNGKNESTKALVANFTLGSNASINSSRIEIANGKTGSVTWTVPTGYTITSVKFIMNSTDDKVKTFSATSGTVTNTATKEWTYAPSASNVSSETFSVEAQNNKVQISEVWVTFTDGVNDAATDYESIYPVSADSESPKNVTFTSSAATTSVTSITTTGNGVSNKSVQVANGNQMVISASKNIKYILLSWNKNKPSGDSKWTANTGSYSQAAYKWTPANTTTKSVTFTRSESNSAEISNIHIVYYPSCQAPTTAFSEGAYTVGESALALSSLISGNNSDGAITYVVKTDGGTGASIAAGSFTATTAGTATITATQAADATHNKCEKIIDFNVVVTASSCAATIPGDISKGALTAGEITLTADGSAESGDTWYWQDAADGTATNLGTGATKNVNTAGTYYIRSYNTAGDCWSAAKSIEVTAEELLEHYAITYNKGAYGTGEIAGGEKVEGVAYTLSSSMFTRENYLQVGWATTDGESRSYMMGGSYTTNAAQEFFPAWAEKDTYSFAAADAKTIAALKSEGWTFNSDVFDADPADNEAYVNTVGAMNTAALIAPHNNGMNDNAIAFAKNTDAYAIYDLGYVTTVSAVTGNFHIGSGNDRTFKIEYIGADGTTVLRTVTVNHNKSNWEIANVVNETTVVPNVRYIKIKSVAEKSWLVMASFSVTYGSLVTKYDLAFAKNGGSGADMATLKYAEDAVVTLPGCSFTAPDDHVFDGWAVTKTASGAPITVTDGKFTMPAEAVTATAQWREVTGTYAVTYSSAHGTAPDSEDAALVVLAELSQSGWAHKGWTADVDVTVDAASVTAGTLIANGKTAILASDVTFTAVWTEIFTVTYNANGGTCGTASATWTEGDEALVLPTATKENYDFIGWYDAATGGNKIASPYTPSASIELFAHYMPKLVQAIYSNSFDAFIKNQAVNVYYLQGESEPTLSSIIVLGVETPVFEEAEGNIKVTIETVDYIFPVTKTAVAPYTGTGEKETFDGTETYVKTGNVFSTESGKLGWKFSKTDNDWSREADGRTRLYFFLGAAEEIAFENGGSARDIKVYRNGVELATPTSSGNAVIAGTNSPAMYAIVSNQTGGDGALKSMTFTPWVPVSAITLKEGTTAITSKEIAQGAQFTLTAEVTPANASNPAIVWESANASIASVDGGVVTGEATGGPVNIIARSQDNNTIYAACAVTVAAPCTPATVAWDVEPADGIKGHNGSASVTTNYAVGLEVVSSDPTVASVSNDGVNITINYLKKGSAKITATVVGDGSIYCNTPASVEKTITVSPDCPVSGNLFTWAYDSEATDIVYNLTKTTSTENHDVEVVSEANVVTISGGQAYLGTTSSSSTATVTNGALRFRLNGNNYAKIILECPLQIGDKISYTATNAREHKFYKNAISGDAVNSVNKVVIIDSDTHPLYGAEVLYVQGSNGDSEFKTFSIDRLAPVTGVSLEDATIAIGNTVTPTMTLLPSNEAYYESIAWSIVGEGEGTIANIDAGTGAITALAAGSVTVQVKLNNDEGLKATCTVEVISSFDQVDVTGSTVWDWTNAAATQISLTNSTTPKKGEEWLMANITGVNNNAQFNSQAILFKGEHVRKLGDGVYYCTIQSLKFNVTVPGAVFVTFASNGSAQRTVSINDKKCSRTTNAEAYISYALAVEPGQVEIKGLEGTSNTYVRISKIEFKTTYEYNRTVNPANIGTLCWTNNAVLGGATLYELAGKNEYNKLVFEEVDENRLEAGKQYVFVPENGNTVIKVYNTDSEEARSEPLNVGNGMMGTFVDMSSADGTTLYGNYVISNNKYIYVDSNNVTVRAYRAYITSLDDITPANPEPGQSQNGSPRRRMMIGGENAPAVATGIDQVPSDQVQSTKVLINGELFILRGEKMYDAKGQLVK